jgi:RHS repeat-associated protein
MLRWKSPILVLLACFLSFNSVYADDRPVLIPYVWKVYSGTPIGTWDSPQAAFAAVQQYLAAQPIPPFTIENLHVCTAADMEDPNYLYRINGIDVHYCWTQHQRTGSTITVIGVTMAQSCPTERPNRKSKSRVVPPVSNHVDLLMWCTGSTGGTRPEPPPPDVCKNECGNPVQVETRGKIERAADIDVDSPLRLERVYTSSTGEWRHTFSDRAWNLELNNVDSLSSNPAPACSPVSFESNSVGIKRCIPYISNSDLGITGAGDWLVQRMDGRTVTFSSITGRSITPGTHETARAILDSSGNYAGLRVYSEANELEEFDRQGRLLRRTDLSGRTVALTYLSASGQKTPSSAPDCIGVTIGVSVAGNPSCVTDLLTSRQLVFHYDSAGNLSSISDPAGNSVTYRYDEPTSNGSARGFHALTSVEYSDGAMIKYHYGEAGQTADVTQFWALTGVTDENAVRFSTFKYDSEGRAIGTSRANGTLNYTFSGTSVVDPLGTSRIFRSSKVTVLASDNSVASSVTVSTGQTIPNAAGTGTVTRTITYGTGANVSRSTDFNGNLTTYEYDNTRNLEIKRVEASGTPRARTIQTAWHPDWKLRVQRSEPRLMSWWIYNGQLDPTDGNAIASCAPSTALLDGKPIVVLCKKVEQETSDSNGASGFNAPLVGSARAWTYTYSAGGQLLSSDDARTDVSDVTSYTHYSCNTGFHCGQLQTVTNAAGQVTHFDSYNAHGQPLTITDPNGVETTLTYDARQRLTSLTTGGELTAFEFWPTGLLKKVTQPDSSFALYTYDDAHRLYKIEDGLGNRLQYTLDAMGNHTAENVYDPSGLLTRTRGQVFNALNQLWKQLRAAGTAAVTTTFSYDNNGNRTTTNAPLSRNSINAYDELNRLKQITDPGNGVTQFGYDANDNLTAVTDPRNLLTSYAYDGFGDLKTQTSPDTGVTSNTYDSAGNLQTSTDARGVVTTYTYDEINRVTSAAFALGGTTDQTISFTYDTGTNGKGRLTGASDAEHTMAWTYDAQGRVIGKGQTIGNVIRSIGYGYSNGQLSTITLPSGQLVTYEYNSNKQVTGVRVGSTIVLSNALYEPFGPVSGWTWGNGTVMSRTYDQDGKLSQFDSAGLKTYTYDDAFRITGIADADNAANDWSYGYNSLDHLTTASKTGTTIGWTYDANGNRLTQTGSSASTYTVSNNSNKINSISGALSRTYNYDLAGNTTAYTEANATYNNQGRMKTLTRSSTTAIYAYNVLGQLMKLSGGMTGTALLMYDEAGHLVGEYSGNGMLVQETVWLGNIPIATLRPNGISVSIYYVHADRLNTPIRVTRPSDNKLMWTWYSNPFGADAPNESPADGGTFKYNLRFPGQLYDTHSALHQNYFRDYDAAVGRYVQSDPIGLHAGISSTYAYAIGNPIRNADPTGLFVPPPVIPAPVAAITVAWYAGTALGTAIYSHFAANIQDELEEWTEAKECRQKRCKQATIENIRLVLLASSMRTLQPSVSANVVQFYVEAIESGSQIQDIKIDEDVIVDGNHRYIATLLCNTKAPVWPYTRPLSVPPIPIQMLRIDP